MCGIAGIISYKGISEEHLKSMSASLQHRGPDGYGYMLYSERDELNVWLNQEPSENLCSSPTAGFAHRRLSIIDLSSANLIDPEANHERQWLNKTGVECLFHNAGGLASGDFISWRFLNLNLWARQHW